MHHIVFLNALYNDLFNEPQSKHSNSNNSKVSKLGVIHAVRPLRTGTENECEITSWGVKVHRPFSAAEDLIIRLRLECPSRFGHLPGRSAALPCPPLSAAAGVVETDISSMSCVYKHALVLFIKPLQFPYSNLCDARRHYVCIC